MAPTVRTLPPAFVAAIAHADAAMTAFDLQAKALEVQPPPAAAEPEAARHPTPLDRAIRQFLADLDAQNKTLTDWARERKLPMNAVYRVAAQKSMGRWGQARKVLRAMGIKPPPVSPKSQGSAA